MLYVCLVTQSCLILCDPRNCSLPDSTVHGDSLGKNIGVGCHALLQEIIQTQGSDPGLLHCTWVLYHLSHQGSQKGDKLMQIFPGSGQTTEDMHYFLLSCSHSQGDWSEYFPELNKCNNK